jgi:hypothetical protein
MKDKITVRTPPRGKTRVYRFQTPGPSFSFYPWVTLIGAELIEAKDNKRIHELMNELKVECLRLKVNFEAKIYINENNKI